MRGLAIHIEVDVLEAEETPPEISSARAGSHWPNVLLMLPEPVEVAAGVGRIRVRCTSSLGSEKPSYAFEVRMLGGGEAATKEVDADSGVLLGTLTYPD